MRITISFAFLIYSAIAVCQFQAPEPTELFRDDVVPRVDILIAEDDLEFILAPENVQSFELFPCTFIFENGTVNDTLENVGFRLRGNTSRGANKKSFKIDVNSLVPGRKYYGAEKINLNGQHNDPTTSRSKVCADIARGIGIPSMRSNHVLLYINGDFYGVYTNVEHIDEEYVAKRWDNKRGNLYKCLYPADLAYKGDNPDLYKEVIFGRRAYALKTNTEEDDYTDIATFIDILNNEPIENLPCALESVFNVDQYLKFIVFDILTGNWDGPIFNQNNFYLYHNPTTDLIEYIPFDLDNTLGIDWFNKDWANRNIYSWAQDNATRPIYNRILQVQEYRDRYTYYYQKILQEVYKADVLFPYLDDLKNKLYPHILEDEYFPLDYGFSGDDFQTGFEQSLPFNQTDYGIKEFISLRRITSFGQLEINDIVPILHNHKTNTVQAGQYPHITASVIDDNPDLQVEICYSHAGGTEISIPMQDDGLSGDGSSSDGIFGVVIAEELDAGMLTYYIKATDNAGQISTLPRCGVYILEINENEISLAINELMADNKNTIADEAGEYDDWTELYNYGEEEIYLGDLYMTDDEDNPDKWQAPDISIAPGEYLLLWMDNDTMQGDHHASFKLSSDGEYLGIYYKTEDDFIIVDELTFLNQEKDISWGRLPNGIGAFAALSPSPEAANEIISNSNYTKVDEVNIYPNPTKSHVIIEHEFSDNLSLICSTIDGKSSVPIHMRKEGEKIYVDVSFLSNGIYLLAIIEDEQVIKRTKVIIRR